MLPAVDQPLQIARAFVRETGLCFLDDATGAGVSRVFARPAAVFRSKDGRGELLHRDGRREPANSDPFQRVAELLANAPHLTAAGYWGYDLRYGLERLPHLAADDLSLPDCWIGFYEGAAEVPERDRLSSGSPEGTPGLLRSARGPDRPPGPQSGGHPPSWPGIPDLAQQLRFRACRPDYEAAVRRVLDYIAAGDCYQVNLSHRISAPMPAADTPGGSAWDLYERLRQVSPAPYAAYLDCGDFQVLSSSPELFLKVRGGEVTTRPIKGTRPRGATPAEDAARAAELLASAKDRAELLMIVDLERNDLGRVCEYGTVHVPELYRLESYSSVHHLVATVQGKLRAEVGPLDALRAAFPGGSITGAPKIRAMEIIEELEPVRRGVYTGAIGWLDGHGNAEWSIAIRTMVVKDGWAHFHVGGGIVADSDPAAEYEETLAKAEGMLAALRAETG